MACRGYGGSGCGTRTACSFVSPGAGRRLCADGLVPRGDRVRREQLAVRAVLHFRSASCGRQDTATVRSGCTDPRARPELPCTGRDQLHGVVGVGVRRSGSWYDAGVTARQRMSRQASTWVQETVGAERVELGGADGAGSARRNALDFIHGLASDGEKGVVSRRASRSRRRICRSTRSTCRTGSRTAASGRRRRHTRATGGRRTTAICAPTQLPAARRPIAAPRWRSTWVTPKLSRQPEPGRGRAGAIAARGDVLCRSATLPGRGAARTAGRRRRSSRWRTSSPARSMRIGSLGASTGAARRPDRVRVGTEQHARPLDGRFRCADSRACSTASLPPFATAECRSPTPGAAACQPSWCTHGRRRRRAHRRLGRVLRLVDERPGDRLAGSGRDGGRPRRADHRPAADARTAGQRRLDENGDASRPTRPRASSRPRLRGRGRRRSRSRSRRSSSAAVYYLDSAAGSPLITATLDDGSTTSQQANVSAPQPQPSPPPTTTQPTPTTPTDTTPAPGITPPTSRQPTAAVVVHVASVKTRRLAGHLVVSVRVRAGTRAAAHTRVLIRVRRGPTTIALATRTTDASGLATWRSLRVLRPGRYYATAAVRR